MRTPFLFDIYPDLKEIPWRSLDVQITPVHRLKKMGDYLGCSNIWIKRDDVSTPHYGGNKPRKLEFIFPVVKLQQKKTIVTMGGIGSNHCLATTILNNRLNLGFKIALALFQQELTADVQKKLLLYQHFGARLIQEEALVRDQAKIFAELGNPYFLMAGGSNSEGTVGFVDAAFELKSQIEKGEIPKPKFLVVTLGSAGTLAGLMLGLKLAGLDDVEILGNGVVDKKTTSPRNVRNLAKSTLKRMRSFSDAVPDISTSIEKPFVSYDFLGGEYGKVTPEGKKAIELMDELEGIHLDTTYTAKTFAFLMDFVRKEGIKDDVILYWNTYNSIDLSPHVKQLKFQDYLSLPKEFHQYFQENLAGLPEE
ncbi:MAG: 1-aminocyclopropane-1-carboxylate deaminase/D-cysteine desulfhydrase [Candidatus Helarchaeota archaeon]